ncbi:hypothetical protein O3P69_006445 [Scylla paramamosain]|uniref:Uncharacterized protein n=1 Tax=Scylla paramamosain TaxID=85552 RepID=A0AAW0U3X7_SCYPA
MRANHIGVFGKDDGRVAWIYSSPEDNSNIQDDDDLRQFKLHYFDLKNFELLEEDMAGLGCFNFFLTNDNKKNNKKSKYDIHDVKNKLYSLNRRYSEHFTTAVRNSVACNRLTEDLNTKFNSDMFPLGCKPDSFIRTKAGLVMEHAKKMLADLYLREDSYPDYVHYLST